MGFYNDAFLNNYGDQGTYDVDSEYENPVGSSEYNYLSNETKYLPMTGETNGINPCDNGIRTTGSNAVLEMGLTNWTTINRDYFPAFWAKVIISNHYDYVLKNLGYRFVLNSSTVTVNGLNFDLDLDISNVGFARAFKQRDLHLVMKNTANNAITTHLINTTDVRTWENTVSINQTFNLGLTGTYQLYLWLPDTETTLSTNSDYSIHFANLNTWDSITGYNDLLQTIELTVLGLEDRSSNQKFSFSPNPSSDFISFQIEDTQKEPIQIYNTTGQLVTEETVSNNQKINVSNLQKGIYFIRLENHSQFTYKFIKQ